MSKLDSKIPAGPLKDKWKNHKDHMNLVAPNNRDKIDIIVVGTGLAGGSAAATLAEQGYNVKAFCYQDSPRRAHSIAAQEVSTQLKIIREMVTLLTDCSMIPLKVVTTEQERLTFTD
jgi:heterodisulfide reductase subunit A-like polyferredoxin